MFFKMRCVDAVQREVAARSFASYHGLMRSILKKFLRLQVIAIAIYISACTTSQHKALREIEAGMDKSDVLEKLGNPEHKTRQHGLDRWSYTSTTKSGAPETTFIFFSNGKVTYVGPAPEKSPEPKGSGAEKATTPDKSENFKPLE